MPLAHKPQHSRANEGAQSGFVYFGTPSVSSETLAILIERGFVPSLVVTSTDAPKGRGLVLTPSPTKVLAIEHNIPVITPEKLDAETIIAISKYNCDYGIAVAYGKIFPQSLIDAFPKGVINVHYSLLPKYRGATPLETALLAGEKESGVTIQKMVRELDAGDILAQEATAIGSDETALELRPRLILIGAQLLVDTLPPFERGETTPIPQDHARASHARKLAKSDGLLTLDESPETNWNKYRAFTNSIGTYFFDNGKRMKITKASFHNRKFLIERVIPEGKQEMNYKVPLT